MENKVLQAAFDYRDKGFSVVPFSEQKRPLGPWKLFKDRLMSDEEINTYFNNPDVSIALMNGRVSGNLVTIDIDHIDCDYAEFESYFAKDCQKMQLIRTKNEGHYAVLFRIDKYEAVTNDQIKSVFDWNICKIDVNMFNCQIVHPSNGYELAHGEIGTLSLLNAIQSIDITIRKSI